MTNKTSYLQGRSTIAVEPELQDNTLKVRVRCTRDLRRFEQARAIRSIVYGIIGEPRH